ncbi:MAG: aminotransferase class V-fold PLP-dependent enzyme [Clostridia bacterium]
MEIYLDNAATSHPKPECVLTAVKRALTSVNANPGRSGHPRALAGAQALLSCRTTLAQMLGAKDPLSVVFAFNCTDAINLAIKGSLRPGDHVVSTMLEHNSVLRPLKTLEQAGVIALTLVEPDEMGIVSPAAIHAALTPRTRLYVVTHASNVLGSIQPIFAIGQVLRQAGVAFLVDGAQAFGSLPVDVEAFGATMYAFPGHKGLLGPQGTGGLYLEDDYALQTLREGGTGSSSDSMLQPTERPERYESGTVNLPGIMGLDAGARYVLQNELTLRARERALTRQLLEGLRAIAGVDVYGSPDPRARVGVVAFNVGDDPSGAVADALSRKDIAVRAGLHCAPGVHTLLGTLSRGAVRASVGPENTPQELDRFLAAVTDIARNGTNLELFDDAR